MTSFEEIQPRIDKIFNQQKEHKRIVNLSTVRERKLKLKILLNAIFENEEKIAEAIYKDFKKPFAESKLTEVFSVTTEIKHTIKNLGKWNSPKRVKTPIVYFGAKSKIHLQPKGQVLIISPWNFPFLLAMGPLVSAIAAGNTVILKPSEYSSHTTNFLIQFLADLFEEKEVVVISGDHRMGEYLVNLPFDHIFFTGSSEVGKLVMEAAAKNLTSVTLELGGKSPTIIDESADLKSTAERICWGKFMNAGQTCIAPDYLIVHESIQREFLTHLTSALTKFYANLNTIQENKDYSRIIDEKHFNRLDQLITDAKQKGADFLYSLHSIPEERFFPPTVITDVNFEMNIMKEEIFGPILPIIPYKNEIELFDIIEKNPNPLALYIFSQKKTFY